MEILSNLIDWNLCCKSVPVSELPFSTPGQSSQPARWCPCGWPQQLSGSIAATFVPMIYQCNSMCWHYHIYHHCWWIIISYDNSMPIMCLSVAVISYLDFPLAISEPVWHRPRTLQRECDVADKSCTYLQVGCGCMAQRMARACANDKWKPKQNGAEIWASRCFRVSWVSGSST